MNILVVDDEKNIAYAIAQILEEQKWQVTMAYDGQEGLDLALSGYYDVAILDIMLPVMNGFEVVQKMRANKIETPTLLLSALDEIPDKVKGLNVGADDYMTKPFSPKELMARIRAILKRSNGSGDNLFVYKNLKVDKIGHSVIINDKEVMLTPKEYNLLIYFIDNKNVALSREQLLSKVWGYDFFGDDRTIDTHIKMLRNNLGEYRNLIKTVRAVGYKFEIKD